MGLTKAFQGLMGSRYNPNFNKGDYSGKAAFHDVLGARPMATWLAMMKDGKPVRDPLINWFEKYRPRAGGDVSAVYEDAELETPYASGTAAVGTILRVVVEEETAKEFRPGIEVCLAVDATDSTQAVPEAERVGIVDSTDINGDTSVVHVKLRQADGVSKLSNLASCNTIYRMGDANPKMATMPEAIAHEPLERSNRPQKFITPAVLAFEDMETDWRDTDDLWQERRADALRDHEDYINRTLYKGVAGVGTGSNGHPQYHMGGIKYLLGQYASDNIMDYRYDAQFAGQSWDIGGWPFLRKVARRLGLWGGKNKVMVCGPDVLDSITALAEDVAEVQIRPGDSTWGFDIQTLNVAGVQFLLKEDPWFALEPSLNDQACVVDLKNLIRRPWQKTTWFGLKKINDEVPGSVWKHGVEGGYVTYLSLEMQCAQGHGWLSGLGKANLLSPA
jgi:hypothetical protein